MSAAAFNSLEGHSTFPAAAALLPRQGMDLASELRRLLVGYNRAMGAEAT